MLSLYDFHCGLKLSVLVKVRCFVTFCPWDQDWLPFVPVYNLKPEVQKLPFSLDAHLKPVVQNLYFLNDLVSYLTRIFFVRPHWNFSQS